MTNDLKSLYQTIILRHNKEPEGYEKKEDTEYILQAYNPICGDRFTLYFNIIDQRIEDLVFHGFGCAISKASTSVLVKHLKGKTLEEVRPLIEAYYATVKGEHPEAPKDFTAFAAAKAFPGRMKCATLSWDTLKEFLNEQA